MVESTTKAQSPQRHDPGLDRPADQELARRSLRVAFTYVPVTVIITWMTDLRFEAFWPSMGVILLFAVSGAVRFSISRSFDRIYDRAPRAWLNRLAASTLFPALVWGAASAYILAHFGLVWTYYICLLASVSIAASAASTLSPRMQVFRIYLVLVLLPHAATLMAVGHGRQLGLAGLVIVFGIQLHALGAYFHQEFWKRLQREKELEQRAEALSVAHAEVEAADRSKSEFLANMSHEIRTPMNGVLGLTELMFDTSLTATQRDYLQDIKTSGQMLLHVINKILDFSKIEAGKFELECTRFQLQTVIDKIVKPQQIAATQRANSLVVELDPALPQWVNGDELRLWQVLTNLVSNANKFTEHGVVTLHVTGAQEKDDQHRIRFAVSDTGIGITPTQQVNIFEAFEQADGSTTRRFGGTGLGLTISASIIRMMGGQIELTSGQDEGSTFFFTIPLHPCTPPKPTLPRAAAATPDRVLSGVDVLLVEDNVVNAKLASRVLERYGAVVTWAKNGKIGAEEAEDGTYDVILMDIQMPVMDGFEATKRIRAAEQGGARTPIVALTAHAISGYREKCLAAGMDDFLTKPLNPKILQSTIHNWTRATV